METSNESIFNADMRAEDSKVPAKEIAREFVRHYYTMLSEKPQEAGKFYSHESYFLHNDMPEVCGTDNIQKAIQQIGFEDCKARIYSIGSTHSINSGLVLQVCGELALKGSSKRRFLQTFLLYPQSPKKFYVHNDILQWLDKAFSDSSTQQKVPADVNETSDQHINGHNNANENITIDDLDVETEAIDIQSKVKQHPDRLVSPSPKMVEATEVSAENDQNPVQHLPAGARSWAKMVSAGSTNKPIGYLSTQPNLQQRPIQPSQNKTSGDVTMNNRSENRQQTLNRDRDRFQPQRENGTRVRSGPPARSELTLFVSNIPRSDPPVAWDALKSELRRTFEKYGEVQDVSIPKTVMNSTDQKIYAFIDLATQESINRCDEECRTDEFGRKYLDIELPIIKWQGEVHISNRKEGDRGGQSNRGFDNKSGRSNFTSGGSSGGYRRSVGGQRRYDNKQDSNPTK